MKDGRMLGAEDLPTMLLKGELICGGDCVKKEEEGGR